MNYNDKGWDIYIYIYLSISIYLSIYTHMYKILWSIIYMTYIKYFDGLYVFLFQNTKNKEKHGE